ncbi:hypothetical protein K4K59_012088 [Colletotrichum sp. SAR11_240]|nr:hypothetical protein K4K59_012088 [Colletotrichum sp. SAR11_240]
MSFPGGPSYVETEFSKAFSAAKDPDLSNFTATYRERLYQQALDADAGQQDRYQTCLKQLPLSKIIPQELEYLASACRQQPSVRGVNSGDLHDPNEDDTASRATTTETYMDLAQGTRQILSHQQKIVRNFAQNLHAPSPPSYRNPPQTPGTPTRPPRSVPSQLPPAARALSDMTSVDPSRHATPVPQRPARNTANLQGIVASAQHRRQSHFNAQQQQQQQYSQSDQERLRELQSQHESVLQEYTNHAPQMLELELHLYGLQREMSYLAVAERGDGIS